MPRARSTTAARWRKADAATWDACVAASPCATPFHTREWNELLARYDTRFAAKAYVCELASGRELLLPLVARKGALRKGPFSRVVSTQPGVYGGPLASDGPLGLESWREFADGLGSAPFARLDCFGNVLDPLPSELAARFESETRSTQAIELATLPENPRSSYRKGAKHSLTKSERAGVIVERARGASDIDEYFAVYRDSLRRWGKTDRRAYRRELFHMFAGSRLAEIWCARMPTGEIAAGGVFLFTARHCVWWHGAMREEFADACPSNALIHRLLQEARARGCELFDFNPSGGHAGVESFKDGFRPRAMPFHIWTWRSALVAKLTRRTAGRAAR